MKKESKPLPLILVITTVLLFATLFTGNFIQLILKIQGINPIDTIYYRDNEVRAWLESINATKIDIRAEPPVYDLTFSLFGIVFAVFVIELIYYNKKGVLNL